MNTHSRNAIRYRPADAFMLAVCAVLFFVVVFLLIEKAEHEKKTDRERTGSVGIARTVAK